MTKKDEKVEEEPVEPATVTVHDYDPVRPRRRKPAPPEPEPWPEQRADPDHVFDDEDDT